MRSNAAPLDSTDDQAFLHGIAAAPKDSAPRLIYADYLQDHGRDADAILQRRRAGVRDTDTLESWRSVWRNGFGLLLPVDGLEALRDALIADDPRLVQDSTTTPPPLFCVQDWPCEAADALGYCGWRAGQNPTCRTVGEVEEFFAKACFDCDQLNDEAAFCRWFLNWFDDTPRGEMRSELVTEVVLAIEARTKGEARP